MNYIVNKVVSYIMNNLPEKDHEMMIRIDNFDDLRVYEGISRKISSELEQSGLSLKIKLAKNKWEQLKKKSDSTTLVQTMEQKGWIAEEESVTAYRNAHDTNILILLGTEDEDDTGGLMNCYTITPELLVSELNGHYYEIFSEDLGMDSSDQACIDKLYHDLFEFVPIDLCKLSDIFDDWKNQIDGIDDFIALFYSNLSVWGLPYKIDHLPRTKDIKGNKNILKEEHQFISRQLFKKMSRVQYSKYQNKIKSYKEKNKEYTDEWNGWKDQAITSYDTLGNIILGYARGEQVDKYRQLLLQTDFSIIEDILQLKLSSTGSKKTTIQTVTGEPLEAFLNALLQVLKDVQEQDVVVNTLEFNISKADVISMYSDSEGEEESQQLLNSWKSICRHTNGVFKYINRNSWSLGDDDIDIECQPKNIFCINSTADMIKAGYVKAASANKSINTIEFSIQCKDSEGNLLKIGKKELKQEFKWKFSNTESWLHKFSDICNVEKIVIADETYIPIAVVKKLKNLIFAKSEEEFFDLYNESEIDFRFDLVEYIAKNCIQETQGLAAKFNNLGRKFTNFIKVVATDGFYESILRADSELNELVVEYAELGNELCKQVLPENQKWLLDAYIHAFNLEITSKVITDDLQSKYCVVPAWHPATLEKLNSQKMFLLDGCAQWWDEHEGKITKKDINELLQTLGQMSLIQNSVDIFPSYKQQYFGPMSSFGSFSVYNRDDIVNNSRLKDLIQKDAIFDDDFDKKENTRMTDNAKMLYDVYRDYFKAFPESYKSLSIVFIDISELQPVVASIYKLIDDIKKVHPNQKINISIRILNRPENKGGRNYLSYWMDESFSEDENVNIKTYLNEWNKRADLDKFLNGNNDIIFVMNLLKINSFQFIRENGKKSLELYECRFPIVYKPTPVSNTSNNSKRKIELSQPQFRAAYAHTQVAHMRNDSDNVPSTNFIAVREVGVNQEMQNMVYELHNKSYWVVCIDSGMDGALLRNDIDHKNNYSILGFSTGKGAYGQYNLTITARKFIVNTTKKHLKQRMQQLFHWDSIRVDAAANLCIREAGYLDGISLLSAINQKNYNIHEFMAYVLTALREKEKNLESALRIVIHLDSYKHWFSGELEKDKSNSSSRPDFLILEVNSAEKESLSIKATVVECKMSSYDNSSVHIEHATQQVRHGIERLSTIFNPYSQTIKRRYWYAQLYRALAFAQVTFSDSSLEFAQLSSKLRSILDGDFEINWNGLVLGYWLDLHGDDETIHESEYPEIKICDIPQKRIQKLLLSEPIESISFAKIDDELLDEANEKRRYEEREKVILAEVKNLQTYREKPIYYDSEDSAELKVAQPNSYNVEHQQEVEKTKKFNTPEEIEKNDEVSKKEVNQEKDLSLEQTRVLIGTDKRHDSVYWEFGNKQLANRHLLITGTSGQGKTYGIQTLLFELSKSNISSVIFDYTEGFRKSQLEKAFVDRMENHINERVVKFRGVPINPFKRQMIEYDGELYPEKDADIASRFADIMTHVYDFGAQQSSAIFSAVKNGLSKYKDSMNMEYFRKELSDVIKENKSAQTVNSKMTPFFESIEFEDDSTFDWGDVLYCEESTATIFQLTAINRDMQVIITELMLWDLWYYTSKYGTKDKPFVVVLDEAQNLSHKENSPSCKILTEGRKFGWSAWYATQSLNVLSDDEVTRLMQSAFKLYFKPTDDEIYKISKQLDPADGKKWITPLSGLEKGQCIVVGNRVKRDGKFGLTQPTITKVTSFEERK